jgi:hypothetical protein
MVTPKAGTREEKRRRKEGKWPEEDSEHVARYRPRGIYERNLAMPSIDMLAS